MCSHSPTTYRRNPSIEIGITGMTGAGMAIIAPGMIKIVTGFPIVMIETVMVMAYQTDLTNDRTIHTAIKGVAV
jgi:hypothetical protein